MMMLLSSFFKGARGRNVEVDKMNLEILNELLKRNEPRMSREKSCLQLRKCRVSYCNGADFVKP